MRANPDLHRYLLAVLLVGNALAFAGIDSVTRTVSAVLVLVLMIDLQRVPAIPVLHRITALAGLVMLGLSLVPMPFVLRRLLQPGLAEEIHTGWAPLSLAPWATIETAAALVVAVGIALVAARMAMTRTGLPTLLTIIAATGGLLAVLGLATETSAPDKVLAIRLNTGSGTVYGPYVNHNHFALGLELTLPALVVLLAVACRHLPLPGSARRRASVIVLATGVAAAISCAAMLRCGSRGGLLAILGAWLLSLPLWKKPGKSRPWLWLPLVLIALAGGLTLAWTELPRLQDRFAKLLVLEGVDGNDRIDLWAGTVRLWQRCPLLGSGPGSYPYVIGLDKPATGEQFLEKAHNSWLEWLATSGVVGAAVLMLAVVGFALLLRPQRVRRLRFEYRYPLAGAAWALCAVALHEVIGFGLATPLNRYLLAAWLGLVWGLSSKTARPVRRRTDSAPTPAAHEDQGGDDHDAQLRDEPIPHRHAPADGAAPGAQRGSPGGNLLPTAT